MYVARNQQSYLKINLHTHTTCSDGRKSPEEVAAIYRAAGYDAIAITDHWIYTPAQEIEGLTIISGCEYNINGPEREGGVEETYHIVALACDCEPSIDRAMGNDRNPGIRTRARTIIAAIHEAGGLAVLAHPAWSLNTPEQMMGIGAYDATEIYNSVSDWGMSDRPYSGLLVDEAATHGLRVPLLATDDAHYYDGDHCRGFIMAEAEACNSIGFHETIRRGRFYASMGPEITSLDWLSDTEVRLTCSPVSKIAFLSNGVWTAGRMVRGEGLTEATYCIKPHETFLRVEITDAERRTAYSNILDVRGRC